jgi:hypothetical protein
MIMFLILMADLDVYQEFTGTVYVAVREVCLYSKSVPVETRGE